MWKVINATYPVPVAIAKYRTKREAFTAAVNTSESHPYLTIHVVDRDGKIRMVINRKDTKNG